MFPYPQKFWSGMTHRLVNENPWIMDLKDKNREESALKIAEVVLAKGTSAAIVQARHVHDEITGVHKTMYTLDPEKVCPWAMEPAFKRQLSQIPNLQAISPALAAAFKATESELQS
jgi:hypothetical protein